MTNPQHLTTELKSAATRLGFQLTGVCPAVEPVGFARFQWWLDQGYAGEMHYLRERVHAYQHPRHVLEGVRSILVLGMNYATAEAAKPQPGQGNVSRYAWGTADYHDVVHRRLKQLRQTLLDLEPGAKVRGVVDTAPLLEREFAVLAGLGWTGKNTLLLNKKVGSWFFLAALLTDQPLEYDTPRGTDHCGTCQACLDACPTNAFPQPYVLDARRCISYLTIELRSLIPTELRLLVGDWTLGCDICQDVCPWNRPAPHSSETAFQPREDLRPLELTQLFRLSEAQFRQRFRTSPLWRPKRRGLLRNAAIALGNQRATVAISALEHGLKDQDAIVRSACAWALGQFSEPQARESLQDALARESDLEVKQEIRAALGKAEGRMKDEG